MPTFITESFLKKIAGSGKMLDGLAELERLSASQREALPVYPDLTAWECVLEEVLDTDHELAHYAAHAQELLRRGYSRTDIQAMRMIAWATAGWYNYEMLVWDWCQLTEEDMMIGLDHRLTSGNLAKAEHEALKQQIIRYRQPVA